MQSASLHACSEARTVCGACPRTLLLAATCLQLPQWLLFWLGVGGQTFPEPRRPCISTVCPTRTSTGARGWCTTPLCRSCHSCCECRGAVQCCPPVCACVWWHMCTVAARTCVRACSISTCVLSCAYLWPCANVRPLDRRDTRSAQQHALTATSHAFKTCLKCHAPRCDSHCTTQQPPIRTVYLTR
jgi:hypothetical protein